MEEKTPSSATGIPLERMYNLLQLLLLAAVVCGAVFARGCTNWSFRHHYLPSELFVDAGRLIFVQPDGSLTAIDIATGAVLKRLFAEKGDERSEVHTTFLTDYDKLIADAAGQTLVLDRDSLELRFATGDPVPPRRNPYDSGERYGDVYDGPETPEYAGKLTDGERLELGLPPAGDSAGMEQYSVFPGRFVFNHMRHYYEATKESSYRVFYAGRSGSWSGDVSYISRDEWFNRVDRVYITDDEIIIAVTHGQIECLERITGRSRWLYVFPTKRYFLGTGMWNLSSWDFFYTSQKRRYDRELRDTRQRGTVLDAGGDDVAYRVITDPHPTNFYFWRTVLAYAIVYIPLAALVVFLAHMALALWRRQASGGRIGLFAAEPEFSLFTMGWHCVFLSFATNFFLMYFFHVSRVASGLYILAGAVSWLLGVSLFVASRRERKKLTIRLAGWLLAVLCLAFAGCFAWVMGQQLLVV